MTWLVVPVKSLADGKSRIAPYVGTARQRELNVELLARTLALAARYPGLDRTLVVSNCHGVVAHTEARDVACLSTPHVDLNEAVAQGVARLRAAAGEPLLVLAADLPLAQEADVRALARPGEVVLATDRAGTGTNALCLPAGTGFRFCYGPASRRLHAAEAARCGLPCRILRTPSLAFDVDTFDDYCEWRRIADSPVQSCLRENGAPYG